jgi:hypothetical protein
MKEYLLDHRNYFEFDEHFGPDLHPSSLEKLVLKNCGHGRVILTGSFWPNLKELIIQGGHYLDIRVEMTETSQLREVLIANAKYVNMLNFQGTFPQLRQWAFDRCKFLSLKGPFIGKMALEAIRIRNCPHLHIFELPGIFPYLKSLEILESHHIKVDLSPVEFPQLTSVLFDKCKVLQIRSLGQILNTLQSFRLLQCRKVRILERDLNKLRKFPGFEYIAPQPDIIEKGIPHEEIELSNINNPDLQAMERDLTQIEQEFRVAEQQTDTEAEQEQENSDDVLITKFCPKCGTQALGIALFCPNCGNPFRQ